MGWVADGVFLAGCQQAAGGVARGLPEKAVAGFTDTFCGYLDDVKTCASMHSCSEVGRVLQKLGMAYKL